MKKLITIMCLTFNAVLLFSAGRIDDIAESASFTDVDKVIVENGSIFSVEVSSHDLDTVLVEYTKPEEAPFTLEAEHSGNQLFLNISKDLFSGSVRNGVYRISLIVPESCNVKVNTATGAVSVEKISAELDIQTDTGSIKLRNCTGSISLESDTGTVYADFLEGVLDVNLDVGNLNLSSFYGEIQAITAVGSINAVDIFLENDSKFKSDVGRIHLSLLNNPEELSINASSDIGSISIFGESSAGKLKTGSGPVRLTADSDVGSITID